MKKHRHARFRFGLTFVGICLSSALPFQLAEAQEAQWKEGVHYTLSRTAADQEWEESTIGVSVLVSYAYPESAKFARDFPKWKASLPKFVHANLRAYSHDQRTSALAILFNALENLKRADLHLKVFLEETTPGKSLVVMKSAQEVDLEQTQLAQERFLQPLGVAPEDFRRAINDPSTRKEILDTSALIRSQGAPSALPAVFVNYKYITDLKLVGAIQTTDSKAATDKLFEVTNHLIALADIDNVQAAATESGLLRDLANDPVLHVWHTVVPNLFEFERKSGIWYFDRDGVFGGPAILTDLDTGKTLTGNGAARLSPALAPTQMLARTVWADKATIALRAGVHAANVERRELGHVWQVGQLVNRLDVVYFLTADGRYHLVTLSQQKEIAQWQATLDSLVTAPGAPGKTPLKEGMRDKPTSPEVKTMRANVIANIADADTIVYETAGAPRATLTVFLDPKCNACRRFHHEAEKFAARGIRLRFIPVFHPPLATNIWCARDRRAALGKAMQEVSLWPACAGEARDGFAPLYRAVFVETVPATFNNRGEIVVGYTTPDELIRLLVN